MATFLRGTAALVLLALFVAPTLHPAFPQTSVADQTLLNAANRDRAAAGLSALHWDPALAKAAHEHAVRMAQSNQLSHQFPGEPPVQDRARQAGARFSQIAENVAQGTNVTNIHMQWMNSPPHRANLLDPELNAVGISVVQSGNMLFAVEDFSNAVPSLSLQQQEQQVAAQLDARGLRVSTGSADARKTCQLDRGWAGPKPALVLRYEMADLTHLPDEVMQRVNSGKYSSASVGACSADSSTEFARFRVAILLF
ncbi:MAG TPA: CAP domain-containing protein [Candidatus Eremiobacteraceae bacterium]|nr:CAP domain-containing protein [Candidatus Eremiobacteraceae bacterium]